MDYPKYHTDLIRQAINGISETTDKIKSMLINSDPLLNKDIVVIYEDHSSLDSGQMLQFEMNSDVTGYTGASLAHYGNYYRSSVTLGFAVATLCYDRTLKASTSLQYICKDFEPINHQPSYNRIISCGVIDSKTVGFIVGNSTVSKENIKEVKNDHKRNYYIPALDFDRAEYGKENFKICGVSVLAHVQAVNQLSALLQVLSGKTFISEFINYANLLEEKYHEGKEQGQAFEWDMYNKYGLSITCHTYLSDILKSMQSIMLEMKELHDMEAVWIDKPQYEIEI